jgi:hypothetical protein
VLGEPGPRELMEQLSAIERAGGASQRLAAASIFTNGLFCAAAGALQGACVLIGGLETDRAIGLGVMVALLVVALGLVGFSWMRKRAARLGWYLAVGRREIVAVVLLLFGQVIRDSHLIGPLPAVWIPWALLTGGPMVVLGVREALGRHPVGLSNEARSSFERPRRSNERRGAGR